MLNFSNSAQDIPDRVVSCHGDWELRDSWQGMSAAVNCVGG
jgi:hypothetical protein